MPQTASGRCVASEGKVSTFGVGSNGVAPGVRIGSYKVLAAKRARIHVALNERAARDELSARELRAARSTEVHNER